MKANQVFRSLRYDNDATVHIPRLLAITIPFLIVTGAHMLHAIGVGVPEILLEPVFGFALIASGAVIAVLGMSAGLMPVFLIILLLWACFAYVYISMVLNLT